jgi:hypothetical protein
MYRPHPQERRQVTARSCFFTSNFTY